MTATAEQRAAYIAGLRVLADTLEQHPELDLPYTGRSSPINVIPLVGQREQVAAWARVMTGTKTKSASGDGNSFYLDGTVGVRVCVITNRDEVCERVVVGTREVTRMVPAPDAPMVEVTSTEEIVDWVCRPILADASSSDGGEQE